jgi:E3 ubiquitin-protein ligase synoviolin
MEWVFAMSTFRDEFGIWFLTMFLSMFSGKVWGWIAEGRVEQLEQQPPINGQLYQPRLIASLIIYLAFAIQMFYYSLDIVLYEARPGMTVMFVFEFAILWISAVSTCIRYGIWIQEHRIMKQQLNQAMEDRRLEIRAMRQAEDARAAADTDGTGTPADIPDEEDLDENDFDVPGWEAKRGWLFVLDITTGNSHRCSSHVPILIQTDLLKLLAYIGFFTILTVFYGIPIYIIRDLYMTMRSFTKRITDYIKYQKATRDMHTRYPDATAEEMESDNTCIVCREEMRPWAGNNAQGAGGAAIAAPGTTTNERQRPKKLPCGHILHFSCLQSWLERQQSCPTCRRSVFAQPIVRGQQGAAGAAPAAGAAADAQAAANNPNGNPNPNPNQPRRARGNEGRVFRLGPIRLQIGGRLGMRDDQQEILNTLARLARDRAAQNPNAQTAAARAALPQHVPGQLPGASAANAHPGLRSATANLQLSVIEAQLRQEIAALNVASDRLATIQALQRELDGLRGFPQAGQAIQHIAGIPRHNLQLHNVALPALARAQQEEPNQAANLPQGMVLPPGWNLVPLNHVAPAPEPTRTVNGIATTTLPPQINIQPQSILRTPTQPENWAAASAENGTSSATLDDTSATINSNGSPAPTAAKSSVTPEASSHTFGSTLGTDASVEPPPTAPTSTWSFSAPAGTGESSASKAAPNHGTQTSQTEGASAASSTKQPTVEDAKDD